MQLKAAYTWKELARNALHLPDGVAVLISVADVSICTFVLVKLVN